MLGTTCSALRCAVQTPRHQKYTAVHAFVTIQLVSCHPSALQAGPVAVVLNHLLFINHLLFSTICCTCDGCCGCHVGLLLPFIFTTSAVTSCTGVDSPASCEASLSQYRVQYTDGAAPGSQAAAYFDRRACVHLPGFAWVTSLYTPSSNWSFVTSAKCPDGWYSPGVWKVRFHCIAYGTKQE